MDFVEILSSSQNSGFSLSVGNLDVIPNWCFGFEILVEVVEMSLIPVYCFPIFLLRLGDGTADYTNSCTWSLGKVLSNLLSPGVMYFEHMLLIFFELSSKCSHSFLLRTGLIDVRVFLNLSFSSLMIVFYHSIIDFQLWLWNDSLDFSVESFHSSFLTTWWSFL